MAKTTIDAERQRIFEILNLPYPERCERMLEICARLFQLGWNSHERYTAGYTDWEENPYGGDYQPRRAVVEDVPGNE